VNIINLSGTVRVGGLFRAGGNARPRRPPAWAGCGDACHDGWGGATTVGEAPTEESTPIPTPPDFLFTPIPATPKFPQRKVGPINEEQLQREMLAAAFSIFRWSTNFRLRSAYYSEIMGAGPGKDDILPTDRPVFETAGEAEKCLTDREPVQVVNVTGDSRAYPLQIMIWHEVVNDTVGGEPVVVTY